MTNLTRQTYLQTLLISNATLVRTLPKKGFDASPEGVRVAYTDPYGSLRDLRARVEFAATRLVEMGVTEKELAELSPLAFEAMRCDIDQPAFASPNERQVSATITRMESGTTVRSYFDTHAIGDSLVGASRICAGVVLGTGLAEHERLARPHYSFAKPELLEAIHTLVLSSGASAHIAQYREARDVVDAWEWLAAEDDRTCLVCIAMNGTRHSLDEDMIRHPGCRCTTISVQKPLSEIIPGLTDSTGPEASIDPDYAFRTGTRDRQVELIPRAAFERWNDGRLRLEDLITIDVHPIWGAFRRLKTDEEISVTPDRCERAASRTPPVADTKSVKQQAPVMSPTVVSEGVKPQSALPTWKDRLKALKRRK